MPAMPRTLPTRLGADDKLIDVYFFSLTVFQVLNVLGGLAVATELLNGSEFSSLPLLVRQVRPGNCLLHVSLRVRLGPWLKPLIACHLRV